VVGAPKAKAFEMIQDLEHTPRGIYTGSLGVLEPGGDFTWSVAIRTIDQRGHAVQLGLGSGVVADSDADAEWAECLLKGRFAGVGI
jgi:anthranilate/para-aminobenzoate synthase component I